MIVITFEDYLPLPRYDGEAWTKARIEEGPTAEGPWVLVEEKIILDLDVDPRHPAPRSFTTELATLDPGYYRIVWVDGDGQLLETDPLLYPPVEEALPEYVPTVTEVADYLHTRTKNTFGVEQGTFSNATRPNAQQVQGLIGKSMSDVASAVDYDIPSELYEQARDLVALGAALRVELAFFAEQVGTDRSPYEELKELYDNQLLRFIEAVNREKAEEAAGDEDAAANVMFAFPSAEPLWSKKF